ncbi:MAG: 5-(carboxyamino)imidazole ribonucleotide mutase [Nitrososphaera sp.]
MGSDSDLPVMKEAADLLESFGVSYEITVVSAHRTARHMYSYAQEAGARGIKVIIAGAGGAAHLPGMVAPINTKSLKGIDSLLSIAQMPPGVPVATVAINGAKNAGILACQILSVGDDKMAKKVQEFKAEMEGAVLKKAKSLEDVGVKKYLARAGKN